MTKAKNNAITGRTVDVTPLFRKAKIRTGKVKIIETEGMYPYKKKIEDNWAFFTAVGIKHLKKVFDGEGKKIETAGIVGICSGVEAIALALIFGKEVKHLIVTDIDAEILQGTIFNLSNSLKGSETKIIPLVGSFCEPIEKKGLSVDFVHANIPNLPATGEEDLSKGAEKGTFLQASLYEKYHPPQKFIQWAMGAQYAYLQSARKVLNKNGTITTEIGGRIPLELVKEMFDECNLGFQEVIVGFKEQTEALIDFVGYARFEKEFGVSFDFYLYKESVALLKKKKISNPTVSLSGKEMKQLLKPFKVSSQEALGLYKKGAKIGHTVHIFRGIKN